MLYVESTAETLFLRKLIQLDCWHRGGIKYLENLREKR